MPCSSKCGEQQQKLYCLCICAMLSHFQISNPLKMTYLFISNFNYIIYMSYYETCEDVHLIRRFCTYVLNICIKAETFGRWLKSHKYGTKLIPTYHIILSFIKKHKPGWREEMAGERAHVKEVCCPPKKVELSSFLKSHMDLYNS